MSRLQEESSVLGVASTSQESPSLMESEKLRVTLLGSEWSSSKGGLSTINRELAIQLAKHPNVDVSVYLPSCSDEDRRAASRHYVQLIEAQESPGFDQPIDWLVSLPNGHYPHCVIGHGVHLGRQIPHIQKQQPCKWIQVVHTAPEELGMFKSYEEAISRGEKKHRAEVRLCELADEVVAIGPKLANAYSRYLRFCKKDQHVFNLTPSIFTEFSNIEQASEERENFCVLVFGRGDHEDFELKGYDIAMEAIAQLKDESYQLKFVGAPEGKEKEVVSKLLHYGIPRSQLTVRCFKEDREQLGNLFCEADLAIMPSRTEGFGLTGLEALSAGLPVLVSGNSGLGQALEKVPGGSSCVIHSEDPKKWASAIRVICQKKRMVRLEEATLLREEYAAKYSWQRQCESLVEKMVNLVSVDPVTWQPLAASEENESSTTVAVQQEDAVEKKSRQASNEKVKRSSSSVTTQSVKRLKDAVVNKSRQASSKEVKRSSSSVATQSVKRPKDAVVNKSRQASSKEVKRSSSFVATKSVKHLKGAVVKKSRQVSNEKVKRRSSSVATQSVKRPKGSDHCLVVEHLEGEYIRRSNVKPLLWDSDIQLPIDEVYTRLEMKWRKKAYFHLTEKKVHMYEIFKPARKGEKGARMVLVEGNPGIGKTTFCLKIASDWAKKLVPVEFHFPMFQLLFLLKCCDIHEDTKDIVQAIDEQLLNDDINSKEEFLDYIRDGKNQDKILLILDGLDELPEASKKVVDRLFERKVFSRCFILATSREEKGIDVRRRYDFDTLLQIKGFTSEDAADYIRKHFKSVDPQNLSKGERLIEAVEENTYLDALRNNPLNLLLLCVVFEDFEGELPSNRTKLYQIIFRCLLRRYCSRNGLNVHRNADKALENQFKESLLVLGELAWNCLREDRRSFSEEELDKLEHSRTHVRRFPAIKLGLVFMEASSRPSQEPRHQCHFLHKTFQEFLAAFYLANQLSRRQLNLTDHSVFHKESMLGRYKEVFFFLAGILGKEGTVFFKEIVTILREDLHWDYSDAECQFLLELLKESGAADDLGKVACSLIPLPNVLELDQFQWSWLKLIRYVCEGAILEVDVASVQLTKLSLSGVQFFSKDNVNDLHGILGSSQTLTELVIGNIENMSPEVADLFAESLSSSTSLRTTTLQLFDMNTERCASNVSTLLSKLSQLECLSLEVFSVLNNIAAQAVKALFKSSLISLALIVHGDQNDCLMSTVSEGLAEETAVESLSLVVYGRVSNPGIVAVQKGVLRNRTLHSLELKVYGDIPDAWMAAVATVLAANKSWKSLIIHPNVCGKIKYEAGLLPYPILGDASLEKSLTVNVCGELSVHSLKALTEFFKESSPLSDLQLNVQSKQSNEVVDCLVDYFLANNSLSSHSIINLSGEIRSYKGTALQRLVQEGQKHSVSVHLNGHDEDHFLSGFYTLANVSSASTTFLVDGKTTTYLEVIKLLSSATTSSFNLTVNHHAAVREDWGKGVGSGLANSLTVNNHAEDMGLWASRVGDGLANSRSLTTFSLTVNNYAEDITGNWASGVGDGLANSRSLTTFSLTVNNHAKDMGLWASHVGDGLANSRSLTTFSLTVNNHAKDIMGNWASGVGHGLANSRSLTTFSLTVNNHAENIGLWGSGVGEGLANSRSLTTFSLTVNNHAKDIGRWASGVGDGLANSRSLTTFSLTVTNHTENIGLWGSGVGEGLANSRSLTTFSLTVNNYAENIIRDWDSGVSDGLANSRSLTTFSLTVNNHAKDMGRWDSGVGEGLANSRSLTTFSLTVNNYAKHIIGDWASGVGHGLANSRSLTTFSLTVNNHPEDMGLWARGVGDGLANSRSLTTFSLTVNNYAEDITGNWASGVGYGLANSRSLTTFSLTVNNHAEDMGLWASGVGDGLANSSSLTTFSLTVNNHAGEIGLWTNDLSKGLVKSGSLTTIRVAFNLYGEDRIR
ncbi:uncharacterized protein [Pocillopora verrucosa]|uniref:uncharacterized protein isoform X2 n=1 Tax=Pocillopora verrucosa TaxID=203993 RepID=UPI0033423CE1